MTLIGYQELKDQVVRIVGQSENYSHLLSKLKDFYMDDIDSERKFEQINTIRQLLNILEVREALSEDNLAPLKEIARRVNDSELMSKINDFEKNHVPRQYINYYAINDEHIIPLKTEVKENVPLHHPFGSISNIKRKRIKQTIIEEIGTFWRDLGRNLKIQERKIQDIDNMNLKLSEKASGLMDVYEERADPQRWFFVLCEALEKSRRKDITMNDEHIIPLKTEVKETVPLHHPFGSISNKKRKQIKQTIIEEISFFWRVLGRNLKIQEGKIQDIDNMNVKVSEKASELMDIYEETADPQRWYFVLCEALEKSLRKDIIKSLNEIMAMNI